MTPGNPKYLGAQFYKCALQVNPWAYTQHHPKPGEKYDDEDEYNAAILSQCKENDIRVVGLAGHNNFRDSMKLQSVLKQGAITVFPGFEIESSEGVHMVCLYREDSSSDDMDHYLRSLLDRNYERLSKDPNTASSKSGVDIAHMILNVQKGFWYAAHMTGDNGLLHLSLSGSSLKEFWISPYLIAGQVPWTQNNKATLNENNHRFFSHNKIIQNRDPNYKRSKKIISINAKDVSSPSTLSEYSASVHVKMTMPGMDSFLDAFYDPESRVRLSGDMRESHHSKILSVCWEGNGFFQENRVSLSKNLNAVIGGHGAGKSTLLESIRYVLDIPHKEAVARNKYDSLCRSNLEGTTVTVRVCSATHLGNTYTISRRFGMPPEVVSEETGNVTQLRPIDIVPQVEIYSQNEIIRIAEDKQAQLHLLDRFLPEQDTYNSKMRELKKHLAENRIELAREYVSKNTLDSEINQLPALIEKLDTFKKIGIEKKMKELQMMDKERSIAKKVEAQIQNITEWISDYADFFELDFIGKSSLEGLPNAGILGTMSDALLKLQMTSDTKISQVKESIALCKKAIEANNAILNQRHNIATDQFQKALAGLPDYAGYDGRAISREVSQLVKKITSIETQKHFTLSVTTTIDRLMQQRRNILKEYTDSAYANTQAMKNAIGKINRGHLNGKVKICLTEASEKQNLNKFFQTIEGVGGRAVEWINKAGHVFPTQLAEIIRTSGEEGLFETYKSFGLTKHIAKNIASACHMGSAKLLELEEVEMMDSIDIQLNTAHSVADPHYRSLMELSTGQQCTAILNIILLANRDPLIIDQPEDNLDNSFIAERIVKDLRECKDDRQFIFATHNANIPIFGDAELILVIDADANQASITEENTGSVDKPGVREAAARILDGGREAFYMRQHKYGFDHDY